MSSKPYLNIILALIFIFILIFILNYLTPEARGDDFGYKFSYVPGLRHKRVENLWNVLASQYYHYFIRNGRISVHIVVQMFTGIWGKAIFNIFNSLVFVFFIFLITNFFGRITSLNLIFSFSIVFIMFPQFAKTMLWLSGSVNYLWTCTGICLLLYFYPKLEKIPYSLSWLLLIIPGFALGCSHEGISTPLAAGFLIHLFIKRKSITKSAVFPLLISFIAGSIICAVSPGTLLRASVLPDDFESDQFLYRLSMGYNLFLKMHIVLILLAILITLQLVNRQKGLIWLKEIYKENLVLFNSLIASLIIIAGSGETVARVGFATELFSLLIIAAMVRKKQLYIPTGLKESIVAASLCLYLPLLYYSKQNYDNSRDVISQLKSHKSSLIFYERPEKFRNMVIESISKEMICARNSHSQRYAEIYDYDSLNFMPYNLYNDIMNGNLNEDLSEQEKYNLNVVRLDDDQIDNKPFFLYKVKDKKKSDGYKYIEKKISEKKYEIIRLNETWYLMTPFKMFRGQAADRIIMK